MLSDLEKQILNNRNDEDVPSLFAHCMRSMESATAKGQTHCFVPILGYAVPVLEAVMTEFRFNGYHIELHWDPDMGEHFMISQL